MSAIELPYVQAVHARGQTYWYFRHRGRRTRLTGAPGSPEFLASFEAARTAVAPPDTRAAAGSMAALVASWHATPAYQGRRSSTKRWDTRLTDWLCEACGDRPVAVMDARAVRTLMAAHTPAMGNKVLSLLRVLIQHAISLNWRDDDPTRDVQRIDYRRRPFPTWTDDDLAAFERHWPSGSRARLAYALLLHTGQRRGDVIRMGWQHIAGGRITIVQEKTGARISIPIHPGLQAELDATDRNNLTLLMTATGAGFASGNAFYNWFRDCIRAAGIAGKSPHGMRKATARRLIEAGCTPHEAAAVSGHRSLGELIHYAREADQARLADVAIGKIAAADRGGARGVANISGKSGKLRKR
jgi:integrase